MDPDADPGGPKTSAPLLNINRKDMSRVQRGPVGSTLACCRTGPSSNPARMFTGGAGKGEEGQAGDGARETGAAGAGGARTEVLLNFFLKLL
jgi:hypothetical protein